MRVELRGKVVDMSRTRSTVLDEVGRRVEVGRPRHEVLVLCAAPGGGTCEVRAVLDEATWGALRAEVEDGPGPSVVVAIETP